jgi:hypothetical protein
MLTNSAWLLFMSLIASHNPVTAEMIVGSQFVSQISVWIFSQREETFAMLTLMASAFATVSIENCGGFEIGW